MQTRSVLKTLVEALLLPVLLLSVVVNSASAQNTQPSTLKEAQNTSPDPPKLIEILLNKGGEGTDANIRAILRQAGLHFIAMRTVAGDLQQSVTIVELPDYSALHKIPRILASIAGLKGVVLSLNETLSLNIGNVPMSPWG
jgi:hypothetical protein